MGTVAASVSGYKDGCSCASGAVGYSGGCDARANLLRSWLTFILTAVALLTVFSCSGGSFTAPVTDQPSPAESLPQVSSTSVADDTSPSLPDPASPPPDAAPAPTLTALVESSISQSIELDEPFAAYRQELQRVWEAQPGVINCPNPCQAGPAAWGVYVVDGQSDPRLIYETGRWLWSLSWTSEGRLSVDYKTARQATGADGSHLGFHLLGRLAIDTASAAASETGRGVFLWPERQPTGRSSILYRIGVYDFDSRQAKALTSMEGLAGAFESLRWAAEPGKVLVLNRPVDLTSGEVARFPFTQAEQETKSVSPDGRHVAVVSPSPNSGCSHLWLVSTSSLERRQANLGSGCTIKTAWLSGGSLAVAVHGCCSASIYANIFLLDAASLEARSLTANEKRLRSRALVSPALDRMAVITADTLRVFDAQGLLLRDLAAPTGFDFHDLAWAPDGRSFAFLLGPANWGY